MNRLKTLTWTQENFCREVITMRRSFETIFSDSSKTDRRRFVFEPWNHEPEFFLLRTQADQFFEAKLFQRFLTKLIHCAQRQFGCHGVSPVWLSLYLNGHRQKTHVDAPHGPLAFVCSLSPKAFASNQELGGQTKILTELVPPRFNQLTVFDPSQAHQVTQVRGPTHPLDGRLVLNGWFVNPRPFVEGPMPLTESEILIERIEVALIEKLSHHKKLSGLLSLSLKWSPAGRLSRARILCSTLKSGQREINAQIALDKALTPALIKRLSSSQQKSSSQLTLPLVFR